VGYLAYGDLRPSGTLKWILAAKQHSEDVSEYKKLIGTSLVLCGIMFPVLMTLGAILIYTTPYFIKVSPALRTPVQIAMGISVAAVLINSFLGIPGNILRGFNLEYKYITLYAFVTLVAGCFVIFAVKIGWGLPGVALASLAGAVLNGAVRFWTARQLIPWLGALRPAKEEVKTFTKMSSGFFLIAIGVLLVEGTDALIVGGILLPSAVSVYVSTGAALRMLQGPLRSLNNSVASGLAGLCGNREWDSVMNVRGELQTIGICIMGVLGTMIVITNQHIVGLWLGPKLYGGDMLNLLLIINSLLTMIYQADSTILDGMLLVRQKATAFITCGMIYVVSGYFLTLKFGILGIAWANLLSRVILVSWFLYLVDRGISLDTRQYYLDLARPFLITMAMMTLAQLSLPFITIRSHLELLVALILSALISGSVLFFFGLSQSVRSRWIKRLRMIMASH
jgi:O-antigen/teichoic acid export membrane protein